MGRLRTTAAATALTLVGLLVASVPAAAGATDPEPLAQVTTASGVVLTDVPLPPREQQFPESPRAVAVDGDRLLVAWDSLWQYDLPTLVSGAGTTPQRLAGEVTDLTARGGDAAGRRPGPDLRSEVVRLGPDGQEQADDDGAGGNLGGSLLLTVDSDRVLFRERSDWTQLVGLGPGAPPPTSFRGLAELVDGVLVQTATAVTDGPFAHPPEGAWPDGLVTRDLQTGRTGLVRVGNACDTAGAQVAGRWLLALCHSGSHVLLDLTGQEPPRVLPVPGEPQLANGVLLAHRSGPDLTITTSWLDLEAPGEVWHLLATRDDGNGGNWFSVSREGATVSAAWVTHPGAVTVATFPVTGSASAVEALRPGGATALPATPTAVTATAVHGAADVTWAHASTSGTTPLGFQVVAHSPAPTLHTVRVTAPADARSFQVPGLRDGVRYTVTVRALNGAGPSTASAGAAVSPLLRVPPRFTVTVDVDPHSDRARVRWTPLPTVGSVTPDSLSVVVGQFVLAPDLPGTATSAEVVVVLRGRQTVTVHAYAGAAHSRSETSTYFPGSDSAAPQATVRLRPSTRRGLIGIPLIASDDRVVASTDIRVSTASAGAAQGPWGYPTGWQRRTGRTPGLHLAPGERRCVSVRARDGQGNTSPWSPASCTTRSG